MTQRLATYLINLDGSDERLARASAALAAAGMPFTRVPAYDGRGQRPEDMPQYGGLVMANFGRRLSGGEIGCFLSHRAVLRRFVDDGATYALVLEDDVTVPPDAAQVIAAMLARLEAGEAGPDWMLANIGRVATRVLTDLGPVWSAHRLTRAHYFPMTSTAILWTRPAAQAFLAGTSGAITMPVDNWIQNWATAAGYGVSLTPALLVPSSALASTIDDTGHRKGTDARGLRYYLAKQTRLWRNKLIALRQRRAFCAAMAQKDSARHG